MIIIGSDPALSHGRLSSVANDVLDDLFLSRGACVISRWSVYIETIGVIVIERFSEFLEVMIVSGIFKSVVHKIKQGFHKGLSEPVIIDVVDSLVYMIIIHTAFSKKTVHVGIPFEISAIGVKGHDGTRSKGVILSSHFGKSIRKSIPGGVKKEVKKMSVLLEVGTKTFIDGEDDVAMFNI